MRHSYVCPLIPQLKQLGVKYRELGKFFTDTVFVD